MKDAVDVVSERLFEPIKTSLPIEERMKVTSSISGSKVILFVDFAAGNRIDLFGGGGGCGWWWSE